METNEPKTMTEVASNAFNAISECKSGYEGLLEKSEEVQGLLTKEQRKIIEDFLIEVKAFEPKLYKFLKWIEMTEFNSFN